MSSLQRQLERPMIFSPSQRRHTTSTPFTAQANSYPNSLVSQYNDNTSDKLVLGIETSCDDTSLALLHGRPHDHVAKKEEERHPLVLAHVTFSQSDLLKKWGGVVPEMASRNHLAKLRPMLDEIFQKVEEGPEDLDAIAVTAIPGLLGPLLTGINLAKTLALMFELPLFPINHLYAHLEAIHLTTPIPYPYLGLLVSGGHSLYAKVTSPKTFEILGNTLDDAAGEAFDKGGKMLGLDYPSGKIIDALAAQGDADRFPFPIGLKNSRNCQLSFSGVKTSLRHFLEKRKGTAKDRDEDLPDICAGYQKAIIDALELKLGHALKKAGGNLPIVVGGGVACNSALRRRLKEGFFVEPRYCTDNGAMIAHYALRTWDEAIPFPECLKIEAQGRFLSKAKRC